ncbi:flavodoxin family protein BilS [Lachnoclostridium sp. An181]|uniref:flavodoxin family protein BilS n=1 Tax=Lachnoclostridium sp. An181 TaxID=1965575 RepID=UPI000B38251F|nr:flavodoxin family protein BilS [Lachnoclostridium sp. An181]
MKYDSMIIFSSRTGNTEKLAEKIFFSLPKHKKDIVRAAQWDAKVEANIYFVGFWVDKGDCPPDIAGILQALHGKKVALFGTCGEGDNPGYYEMLEGTVKKHLSEDNDYLGCFLCQGKMPMAVRARYENMLENAQDKAIVQKMLHNFDEGLLHPDERDLKNLERFVQECMEKITGK